MRDDFGIASVGRLAAEDDRRQPDAAELLVQQSKFDLAVALAAEIGREMTGPKPHLLHLSLKGTNGLQISLGFHAAEPDADVGERLDFVFDELFDPVELLLVFRIGLEIPSHYRLPFIVFFRPAAA